MHRSFEISQLSGVVVVGDTVPFALCREILRLRIYRGTGLHLLLTSEQLNAILAY